MSANTFKALRVHKVGKQQEARLQDMAEEELSPGDVLIEVHHSGVNYKDALAVTGKGLILKNFPLNPGIDAAGIVLSSKDPRFAKGQAVLVNGCGTGEVVDGGFAQCLRVKAEFVVPLPNGLSSREAMLLGTAGFTAALALQRMEHNGQRPDLGPILITGASGGVGSFAVQLFAHAGYEVHAVSGKPEATNYLKELGARTVISPQDLQLGSRPLESVRFGGAVDNVGGRLLGQVLAHVQLWGNVAAVGLAESMELHTTVMPFILRGVSLLGTSSNNTPMPLRHELWQKLAGPWKPVHLERVHARTIGLQDIPQACEDLIGRKVQGRILVDVKRG